MPQPTVGDVHVNRPLTNISTAYFQDSDAFIADRVFPMVPTSNQSNTYWQYDQEWWFRSEVERRAPGTESTGSGWTVSTDTYNCKVWSVHKDTDDQTRANYDSPLDADRDATEWVTRQLLLKRDLEWQSKYFTTNVWGDNPGTDDWTGVDAGPVGNQILRWNVAGSTPVEDIALLQLRMLRLTGMRPNKLVIGPEVELELLNHADILDRIKYTQRGVATRELLAGLFNVDEVLVPTALQNTEVEGGTFAASDDMAFVYGKHALLLYAAPRPSLRTLSAGYTFVWSGLYGQGAHGGRIKKFRMEHIESDRVEGSMAWDQKVVSANCGIFINTAVGP